MYQTFWTVGTRERNLLSRKAGFQNSEKGSVRRECPLLAVLQLATPRPLLSLPSECYHKSSKKIPTGNKAVFRIVWVWERFVRLDLLYVPDFQVNCVAVVKWDQEYLPCVESWGALDTQDWVLMWFVYSAKAVPKQPADCSACLCRLMFVLNMAVR